jgi:MinD superfamily P-loop ATPase
MYICPEKAITETKRRIGVVEKGRAGDMDFIQGILNVGEAMAPPVIKKARSLIDDSKTVIFDAPPGTSCPVIETVRGTDFCLLVTEPTPFGLNDLKLAVEMTRQIGVSCAVIINCWGVGNDEVEKYCKKENIPVVLRIPWDRRIAEGYSRGLPAVEVLPEMKDDFVNVLSRISESKK